ncbi:Hypothetical predicted protein [Cloeon dipterum]|uniref:Secreted protein n=1 Tax=Cloeon dipterum TaxID=197152 RepID=A0A8S1D9J9_9INSE|nr:Hypothetical predicted protein [Cloeon dipterum]
MVSHGTLCIFFALLIIGATISDASAGCADEASGGTLQSRMNQERVPLQNPSYKSKSITRILAGGRRHYGRRRHIPARK